MGSSSMVEPQICASGLDWQILSGCDVYWGPVKATRRKGKGRGGDARAGLGCTRRILRDLAEPWRG